MTCRSVTKKLAEKIMVEMKNLSSDEHDSILRDGVTAVKHFHWETVFLEFSRNAPTLMSLLKQLVKRHAERKPMLCFLASLLLKSRHQHMGLVLKQQIIETMRKKQSTFWSNITTRFRRGREPNFCGAGASTLGAIEDRTFRVIFIWNI